MNRILALLHLVVVVSAAAAAPKGDLFYDNILVKFDSNCTKHAQIDIKQYFLDALSEAKQKSLNKEANEFASVNDDDDDDDAMPDPTKFGELLTSHLDQTYNLLSSNVDESSRQDSNLATRRRRLLGETPPREREDEILSALHLLAASRLVGEEAAQSVVEFEQSGRMEDLKNLIQTKGRIKVEPKILQSVLSGEASKRTFLDADAPAPKPRPIITATENLDFIQLKIIKNPLLLNRLMPLVQMLPCLEFEPEPDRSKGDLSVFPPAEPPRNLDELNATRELLNVEVLDYPTLLQRQEGEGKGVLDNVWDILAAPFRSTRTITHSTQFTLLAPDDTFFNRQWYLKGPMQDEPYGSQIIDGWSSILRDIEFDHNPELRHMEKVSFDFARFANSSVGITVAILDSGCSRNPDIVGKFWRNTDTAGCDEGAFTGTGAADKYGISGDCVGYDFGDDSPDPTKESETKIHGSGTSGLVGAEGNNQMGIAGVCPGCNIMCIKIYDSAKNTITMSAVVRALDYIARKKIMLSNHSYGGFGVSSVERSAHERLNSMGHLSVCSSGNNGCNIDNEDAKACDLTESAGGGDFTPAGYDIDSIFSIGSTTKEGQLAWFSNYGSKSVDAFAPGTDIITLAGPTSLATVQGTSFSAPIVTGMAAMLWSHRPELTGVEVKDLLTHNGIPVEALTGKAVQGRVISLSRSLAAANGKASDTLLKADSTEPDGSPRTTLSLHAATISSALFLLSVL